MPIAALPTEILSLVLAQLRLVRNIKKARVCRALRDAAPEAEKAHRRVCFEHTDVTVNCVAAAPDGRVVTCSNNKFVKVLRDGVCESTIEMAGIGVKGVAMLPGGRLVTGSLNGRKTRDCNSGRREKNLEV